MQGLSLYLTLAGSVVSIGFGAWHLFVPRLWDWYGYIRADAAELVLAVRATNVFFSVSLILFGVLGLLFATHRPLDRFYVRAYLAVMVVLWALRVAMQLVYPQGSMNPALQYGMLAAFVVTFLAFLLPLISLMQRP